MGFSRQEYWSGVPLPSPSRSDNSKNWITEILDTKSKDGLYFGGRRSNILWFPVESGQCRCSLTSSLMQSCLVYSKRSHCLKVVSRYEVWSLEPQMKYSEVNQDITESICFSVLNDCTKEKDSNGRWFMIAIRGIWWSQFLTLLPLINPFNS